MVRKIAQTTRDNSWKLAKAWKAIIEVWRWLGDHLVQLCALPLLVVLAWFLVLRIRAQKGLSRFDFSREDLILVGVFFALALLVQSASALVPLLRKLKKVGPVEFVEERYNLILPELDELGSSHSLLKDLPDPSAKLVWEYEKAETFVTHIEAEGIGVSGLKNKEKFHDLLYKMSAVAIMQKYWARAIDRLELLLRLTDGKYKSGGVHFRCGQAYLESTKKQKSEEQPTEEQEREKQPTKEQKREKQDLLEKAETHLWKATKAVPYSYWAFLTLASAQFQLKKYKLATLSNARAICICPNFARPKYNQACCYSKLEKWDRACRVFKTIKKDDVDAQAVAKKALAKEDPDLKGLVDRETEWLAAETHLKEVQGTGEA